ncbi:MAG: GH32 C-terminal domain-containing protein, partial [Verrucomicrobia bacterium]|nr:GH32 C-terminal domain-containing protein [Verrucomicrobiota bacterium]
QKPLPALQKLRGPGVEMPKATFDGALVPLDFKPEINVYELQVEFELSGSDQDVGLNLCASGSKRVSLGYDSAKGMLYLDRVSSGNDGFSDRFPKYVMTPFTPAGKQLKFHVFVDESSIEVFVNDGVAVLTSQVYPGDNGRGIQIFSRRGDVALKRFIGWELSSIWK